ncbi:23S rRNA (uracil(1939)-C(5))-methyltransferase RlmD [Paenibacillus sp. N1-5-1-14]|uniref:23S rRNA (uracil(1939)-C(5))-methyltransferase RlmD n=1 Tax=Paenibacillus radicibacter TaxID=2972488 RepID=UPI002158B509|nr:23S rRNA (uracil(1939)-C(5))-methyltransferase RlmD [Paenibacillus radicibacter]MCR8644558.1 23S rRNA (uracil(1939)-C(5))-methyltransferase RlmD [Paenibacillus radicibacter]
MTTKSSRGKRSGSRGNRREDKPVDLSHLPVAKNEEYEAEIIGIGHNGEGVGRVDGFTLFIPGALPGERVLVKILKLKKQYGYGKLLKVLEASSERVNASCEIYDKCGGCQLQHLDYEAQIRWKRQFVVDNLERIGKLKVAGQDEADDSDASKDGIVVYPTLGMEDPWRYRNKAQVPIGEEQGGLVGGFYAQGSHRIVDMDKCLIQHEDNDEVITKIKEIGNRLGITAYNEETHAGLLRHVVIKVGFTTGEMMVVLITNGSRIPNQEQWIEEIREALPKVVSICHNVNKERTNVIFGAETRVIWGQEHIYDYIGDVKFAISARSFYQVNPIQTEVLYRKALEYAALSGDEVVVDAYCGIGTISLFLAQHASKVYGVEIVPEAIADATRNAELNEITNVSFDVGAAEDVFPKWYDAGVRADVVVVDPPRKGCDEALIESILAMRPKRVVYVSCSASTLARDLRMLEDGGYVTKVVQPVDMFPHTVHVEAVVLLVRREV